MNASKENARKALLMLGVVERLGDKEVNKEQDEQTRNASNFIIDFLEAAIKRLPTEEAIEKDKERRKVRQEEYKEAGKARRAALGPERGR